MAADDYVVPQDDVPGQVHAGGYTVVLSAPSGRASLVTGPSAPTHFGEAAVAADLIEPDDSNLA